MLLSELHGYKQYLGQVSAVLQKLIDKHDITTSYGISGLALIGESCVYKLWHEDDGFEWWLKYIEEHKNRHFIKPLSKVRALPFTVKVEGRDIELKIIKLEKLYPIEAGFGALCDSVWKNDKMLTYPFDRFCERLRAKATNKAFVDSNIEFWQAYYNLATEILDKFNNHDIHRENVMKRGDGTYVIIDPVAPSIVEVSLGALTSKAIDSIITKAKV